MGYALLVLACLPTKTLAHDLYKLDYKPVEYGYVSKLPYVILREPHGKEIEVVFHKHTACFTRVEGV